MEVHRPEFTISAVAPEQYPQDELPEIALVGRSNVGKSSFINRMIRRKNLARTSSQPGKTQTLNFYHIDDLFYYVDLPGYGFAKVSKQMRAEWGTMIERYLLEREHLRGVILLVDLRHRPSRDDIAMAEWLYHFEIPFFVVATKADKVPTTKRKRHKAEVIKALQLQAEQSPILFSAETGMGRDEAWQQVLQTISINNGEN